MAAAAAKGYRVVGAAAVIRKNGHERYVANGATFSADQLDEDNAKHLLSVGLIEAAKVESAEKKASTITQADVDAAVKTATEAQAAELEQAKADLEAARAELEKSKTPAAPKEPAAKQS
jgi:multidrug efflux pump subunit AcrA (membrane-fusion protein)